MKLVQHKKTRMIHRVAEGNTVRPGHIHTRGYSWCGKFIVAGGSSYEAISNVDVTTTHDPVCLACRNAGAWGR